MMKHILFLITCLFANSALSDTTCDIPAGGQSAGVPDFKIEPHIRFQIEPGDCVLIAFHLEVHPESQGRSLKTTQITTVEANNRRLAGAFKEAVAKWYYRADRNLDTETQYYYRIMIAAEE